MKPLIKIRPPRPYKTIKPLCGPDRQPLRTTMRSAARPPNTKTRKETA